MTATQQSEEDQAALWNGAAGLTWVEAQEPLDRLFSPFEELLVETVLARGARRVLDVGCGTGATTLAIARALRGGNCVGVDISEPMLSLASARAERERLPAVFVRADAETYAFEPGSFDTIVSRFGVMFFADPVRAFANLRTAVRRGGDARARRMARPGRESVHDRGGTCGRAVSAARSAAPRRCAGAVCVRRFAPGPRHPGAERLGRHRPSAARRRLRVREERSRRLPHADRSDRPSVARRGCADSGEDHRGRAARVRSVRRRRRGALRRRVLADRRTLARSVKRHAAVAAARRIWVGR